MLKNKSYIGVRVFSDKKGGKNEVKASWEPIIDIDTFERVGRMLAKNRNHKRTHGASRYPYTLSGSIFCKTCGHRLAGRSAHGATTKVAYYEHTHNRKLQANLSRRVNICTSHHRIRATLIEPLVWMDVKEFLTSESFAMDLLTKAKVRSPVDTNKERRVKLEATGKKLVAQVEALAERIGVLPRGLDPAALYMQLEKLQASRDRIMEELSKEVAQEVSDEYVSLESLQEFTKGLRAMLDKGDQNPEIQAAIMRKIVHKIEVLPDGYEIFYHAGLNHYEKELGTTPGSSFFRLDAINEKRLASLSLKRVRSLGSGFEICDSSSNRIKAEEFGFILFQTLKAQLPYEVTICVGACPSYALLTNAFCLVILLKPTEVEYSREPAVITNGVFRISSEIILGDRSKLHGDFTMKRNG